VKLKAGFIGLKTYPNPVQDQLSILFSSPDAGRVVISITDVNGKQLYRHNFNPGVSSNVHNVDVSRFAAGTYFVRMITASETRTVKFIK